MPGTLLPCVRQVPRCATQFHAFVDPLLLWLDVGDPTLSHTLAVPPAAQKQSAAEQLLFDTAHKHGFGALLGDIDKLNQFRHVAGMVVPPKPLWLRRQQIFKNTDQASIRPLTITLREQLDLRADHLVRGS